MPKKSMDKTNEFKRRKRWKRKLKGIVLRDRRQADKGKRFQQRETELSKRKRAQIVREGEEIAKKRKRSKKTEQDIERLEQTNRR
jgi:hypothetical protein